MQGPSEDQEQDWGKFCVEWGFVFFSETQTHSWQICPSQECSECMIQKIARVSFSSHLSSNYNTWIIFLNNTAMTIALLCCTRYFSFIKFLPCMVYNIPTLQGEHCSSERSVWGMWQNWNSNLCLSDTKSWNFQQEALLHEACFWVASSHSQFYTVNTVKLCVQEEKIHIEHLLCVYFKHQTW